MEKCAKKRFRVGKLTVFLEKVRDFVDKVLYSALKCYKIVKADYASKY